MWHCVAAAPVERRIQNPFKHLLGSKYDVAEEYFEAKCIMGQNCRSRCMMHFGSEFCFKKLEIWIQNWNFYYYNFFLLFKLIERGSQSIKPCDLRVYIF